MLYVPFSDIVLRVSERRRAFPHLAALMQLSGYWTVFEYPFLRVSYRIVGDRSSDPLFVWICGEVAESDRQSRLWDSYLFRRDR